jgi:L-lactate dehydrogenase complex protein LldG
MNSPPSPRGDSRQSVLASIRNSLNSNQSGRQTSEQLHQLWSGPYPDRIYQRAGLLSMDARVALFVERLRDYEAEVYLCPSLACITLTLKDVLQSRGARSIALPACFPDDLLADNPDVTWHRDDPFLSNNELNEVDGVVTLATVAVAISGSIALQHGPKEGRRLLTLLPDFHICILTSGQIVETLPEALERLHAAAARPTTFISGPSATADIEMTRIKGVHGPRSLCVLIVTDDALAL